VIYDISLPLSRELAVWPGDCAFSSRFSWQQASGDSVTVGAFEMSAHAGTHTDAPFHVKLDGEKSNALRLDAYLGPATVLDVSGHELITPEVIRARGLAVRPRLLLRTGGWPDPKVFPERIPVISPEVSGFLGEAGVVLLGLDVPSVDPIEDTALANHHRLMERGIRIVESVDLRGLPEGDYLLMALPLRLVGMDAAPLRAVLVDWETARGWLA
jgi:arylformamidase